MGRPKNIRDPLTLSEACKRYAVTDSTLRLWIRTGKLKGHGKRPVTVSESALVALLQKLGRAHEPQDDTPAPVGDDDPVLDLATVADLLGVKKQTASAYKTEEKLRSYRRSDVLAYRDSRQNREGYKKTGLADARAEGAVLDNEYKTIRNLKELDKLYDAERIDLIATELGRLMATHRQQGAQRITAVVTRELGEAGLVLSAEHRTAVTRAVGDALDHQGQAIMKVLENMGGS